jgi:hypothetical protein
MIAAVAVAAVAVVAVAVVAAADESLVGATKGYALVSQLFNSTKMVLFVLLLLLYTQEL